jgi:FO synthase
VNPEAPWPHLTALAGTCAEAGFVLRPRLCVYPDYVSERWLDPRLRGPVDAARARLHAEWRDGVAQAATTGGPTGDPWRRAGDRAARERIGEDEHASAL